jgi:hypothetical protein
VLAANLLIFDFVAAMLRRPGEPSVWWLQFSNLFVLGLGVLLFGHSINFYLIAVDEERFPHYHDETHDLCHSLSYLFVYLIFWFSVFVFLIARNRYV